MPRKRIRRRVCFVTGTRAEFGLMESSLRALARHRTIDLQLIATGVHTHPSRGHTVDEIRRAGWKLNAVVPWKHSAIASDIARETGRVTGELVDVFDRLKTDVVLIVGDRVEAFAAASAAHLSGRLVAHVHGGDRAMGQADDSLRHAISKLAHLHLPATAGSAERLFAMGEERSRIITVGAPGVDGIRQAAASRSIMKSFAIDHPPGSFTLLLLHPTDDSVQAERERTRMVLRSLRKYQDRPIIALLPNNDPGAQGIVDELNEAAAGGEFELYTHVSRSLFLGLLRDCRCLVGNSSAGIIEAGSFGTRVVNIGPRQAGRERGSNVIDASWTSISILRALSRAIASGETRMTDNPYDLGGAAPRIAAALAGVTLDGQFRKKLIRY